MDFIVVYFSLDVLKTKLKNGALTFEEMEAILGNQFQCNYSRIQEEMRWLQIADQVIEERIEQLRQQRGLESCVRGANILIQFKERLKLQGDFGTVERIAKVRFYYLHKL